MKTLTIGTRPHTLGVSIHRTVRIAEGRAPANLPPSRGLCDLHAVDDYECPEAWEAGGVFVGLHPQEAIWLSFDPSGPLALLVGAGGVNALTGKPLAASLKAGGYMVAPPQPWLDGWKDAGSGSVFQFVAAQFKGGDGLSVGEQILGSDSVSGGIGIAVFAPTNPLPATSPPKEIGGLDFSGSWEASTMMGMTKGGGMRGMSIAGNEMGLGKGGAIKQRIYPDPHGLKVWSESPASTAAIYLVDAKAFHEITGGELSPSPIGSDEYKGTYFDLDDKPLGDVGGSKTFVGLKSVFAG